MDIIKQILSFLISLIMVTFSLPGQYTEMLADVREDHFFVEAAIENLALCDVTDTVDILVPLESGKEYSDSITGVDERHIYTFTAEERGYIDYEVSHGELKNFSGWEFTLYREYYLNGHDGEKGLMPLNVLKTTAYESVQTSPVIGIMPGKYRIIVSVLSGVSDEDYKFKATFTAAYDHEIECNDSRSRYTEIYGGVPMIGSASVYDDKQDDDWYLLRVRSDGTVNLSFAHAQQDNISVAWRVVLYNETGEELYSENSGMNTALIESGEIGIRAGYYYIAVLGRVHTDVEYTLTVETSARSDFEKENNDTRETADMLSECGIISGCITSKNGKPDRDFFRVYIEERGSFSLMFSHAPCTLNEQSAKKNDDKDGWRIKIYTDDGVLLYSMISTWNTEEIGTPALGVDSGTYYIEVNCEDLYRNTAVYSVTTDYISSDSTELEPNGTFGTSNHIANGVTITGTIVDQGDSPDDDYFSFNVYTASDVTVKLQHETNSSNRDIFNFTVYDSEFNKVQLMSDGIPLTDANGNGVYTVQSLGNQAEAFGNYELLPGRYYIKVTSGRFFDTMSYNLTYYL